MSGVYLLFHRHITSIVVRAARNNWHAVFAVSGDDGATNYKYIYIKRKFFY
jgi:hypothetical protein